MLRKIQKSGTENPLCLFQIFSKSFLHKNRTTAVFLQVHKKYIPVKRSDYFKETVGIPLLHNHVLQFFIQCTVLSLCILTGIKGDLICPHIILGILDNYLDF